MANADRIIELLHEAKARPAGAERAQFLAEACGDDAALKEQIISLLEADAKEGESDFLKITRIIRPAIPVTEKPGDRIDRYKLLEQIGEGGCGVVYMAEQLEPVRRRVALKVIKLGMDTKQVIARFEAEWQALALMDHPNIAKVLDAGATETGRPYFVMELVRGIKITDYCDQNNLSTAERLELFIQVCQAIQHAHQKGIIHRDIKPSNILVTQHDDVAVPKVIDFGIAKATVGQLTDKTVFTAFAQFIGTPAYMSPEQAQMSGLDIDTRADIYSLGVLLYELLTGHTPFDAKELLAAGMDEMRRKIREDEPAKPSTRLSTMQAMDLTTVAKRRHVEPPRLIHLIRGDLDWLVMKCLEKDRTRRYETANGLVMDIQRHLNNEPVTACPPSRLYEFRKTVRRHKFGFAAAAALILVLGLGVLASSWQAIRATRAEREQIKLRKEADVGKKAAQTEAAKSEQVAQFMQDMLKGVGPSVALGRDTTLLREILDQTALRLDELKDQPSVQVSLQLTLAQVYADLAEYATAERICRSAVELQKHLVGTEHPDLADSMHRLAGVILQQGRHAEAEALYLEVVTMRRKLLGSDHPTVADSLHELSMLYRATGSLANAENTAREVVTIRRARFGEQDRQVAIALQTLAWNLKQRGKYAEAEDAIRQSIATRKALFGNEHSEVIFALFDLAVFLHDQGKNSESEGVTSEVLAMRSRLIESKSLFAAQCLHQLAWVLHVQGRHVEAEMVSREALGIRLGLLGKNHPDIAHNLRFLGLFLRAQGKLAEAETVLREALSISRERLGIGHATTIYSMRAVTDLLRAANRVGDAVELQRGELAACREVHGADHPATATLLYELGNLLRDTGQPAAAEPLARESLAIRRAKFGAEHLDVGRSLHSLGWTLFLLGRYTEAEAAYRGVLVLRRKALGYGHLDVAWALYDLSYVLIQLGQLDDATATARETVAIRTRLDGGGHPGRSATLALLTDLLKRGGKLVEAEALWREELATRRKEQGDDSLAVATCCDQFAGLLRDQRRHAEAETMIREALAIRRKRRGNEHIEVARTLDRLTSVLRAQAKLLEAESTAREGFALHQKISGDADPETAEALKNLADVLFRRGRYSEAKSTFLEASRQASAPTLNEIAFTLATAAPVELRDGPVALTLAERAVTGTKRKDPTIVDTLAAAYAEVGQFTNAVRVQQEAIALLKDEQQRNDYVSRLELYQSGLAYRNHSQLAELTRALLSELTPAKAEPPARECLALREHLIPDSWLTFNARSLLGASLLGQKKYAEAEPFLVSGYEGMKLRKDKIPPIGRPRLQETLQRLVQLYEATDQADKAAEWNKKLAEFDKAEAVQKTAEPKP